MNPIETPVPCSGSCAVSRLLEVDLHQIRPMGLSPHLRTDPAVHRELAHDLRRQGQREPLMVVEWHGWDGTRYSIVDGERRYHAATLAGWQQLTVRVHDDLELDEETLYRTSALANFERGTLTAYEETRALLQMLAYELADRCEWQWIVHADHVDREATAGLLKLWVNATTEQRRGELLLSNQFVGVPESDLDAAIASVFNAASMNPVSFVRNKLPLLDLRDDVLDAHQHAGLAYTAARIINEVDDADKRAGLIQAAPHTSTRKLRQMVHPRSPVGPTPQRPLNPIEQECHGLAYQTVPLLQRLPPLTHNEAVSVRAQLSKILRTLETAGNHPTPQRRL